MTMAGYGTGWTVTDQIEAMEMGSTGQATRGMRIFFTTSNGHKSSVFVTAAQYMNTDFVRDTLATAAAQVSAVANLSG